MPTGRPHPRALCLLVPVLVAACPATARAAGGFHRDRTPLPSDVTGAGASPHAAVHVAAGGGGAALHMLLGLAVVLGLIYGIYRLLRRSAARNDKTVAAHGGMAVVASTPLGPSRSVHLLRVGSELVLVGAGEQGVTPIRVYAPEEIRRLGLEDEAADPGAAFIPTGAARPGFAGALLETLRKMTAR